MVRKAYWSYLAFVVVISYNMIGSLVALCAIGPASGRLPGFFLAAVYWFAGVPGAWFLWCAQRSGKSLLTSLTSIISVEP